ncbi:cytochrome b/b6 domain-containing protein [Cognatishimia sp. MH4019]|uniref:cytochrome b/b6 domain-containing protein n=1 Tax=Cognatishimia sp. MH4019 TaxID=2854030 RepID=UPI001CD2C740|nr:cytochrome b/b6 domain-containing protein [Cognatishimia sp. MH4019]
MPLANTAQHYGSLTKTFHWLTAALIITLIPLGIIANQLPYDTSEQLARKAFLFSLHKTLGVTVFFVALARIAWAISQPKPAELHPDRKLETLAAQTVHWLLYGSLLLVPLSGWIHHAATTGFAPIWWPFGQNLPFVPKDDALAHTFASLHIIFERVLAASLILHIAGALKHHFVDKDQTLRRMIGTPQLPDLPPHQSKAAAPALALGAWAAALVIGAGLGLFAAKDTVAAVPQLEETSSGWEIVAESSRIAIAITQFGATVEGEFAEWTTQIDYDRNAPADAKGTVRTTIAIPSLTLGSVTDQAMGPDYFNTPEFPTAVFEADISEGGASHIATGTLTIKDNSVPLTMPFDLGFEGDTAFMSTTLTLDRRDFGIGDNMTDETSLAYPVTVTINIEANPTAP